MAVRLVLHITDLTNPASPASELTILNVMGALQGHGEDAFRNADEVVLVLKQQGEQSLGRIHEVRPDGVLSAHGRIGSRDDLAIKKIREALNICEIRETTLDQLSSVSDPQRVFDDPGPDPLEKPAEDPVAMSDRMALFTRLQNAHWEHRRLRVLLEHQDSCVAEARAALEQYDDAMRRTARRQHKASSRRR